MNKVIRIGSLLAVATPVAIAVSCGNVESNTSKEDSNTSKQNTYVQTHKDSSYPTMDQDLYDLMDGRDAIWYKFYQLKGKDYFKDNKVKSSKNMWWDNYIMYRTSKFEVVMNWHELYDFAHNDWLNNLKLSKPLNQWSHADQQKILSGQPFPYYK